MSRIIPKESQELKACNEPYRSERPNGQRKGRGFKTTQLLFRHAGNDERRIYGTRVRRVLVQRALDALKYYVSAKTEASRTLGQMMKQVLDRDEALKP